jgi:uncharacterized protein YjeT (DUF2065 family)
MHFQWKIFIAALGLALILEGTPWFLSPEAAKRYVSMLLGFRSASLRVLGLTLLLAGLALVALSRVLG